MALQWSSPGYSFVERTISDLGARACEDVEYPQGALPVCSPAHEWLNVTTIAVGVLVGLGALLMLDRLTGRRRPWAAAAWVITGLSTIGAGLVSVTDDLALHSALAFPALLTQNIALLLSGGRHGLPWRVAPWLGAIGLVAAVLLLVGTGAGWPAIGLVERVALWPGLLWLGWAGAAELLRERATRAPSPT